MRYAALATVFFYCASALAADGLTPEQQRLRSCNTKAKEQGLSSRERSRFITDCMNGRKGKRPLTPLQARNEACTKEADSRRLEGAERRGFMSDCNKPDRVKQETPQHVKLENCNRRAVKRGLGGDEKTKFVAACLDGSGVAVDG
jgi:hypothetical protein